MQACNCPSQSGCTIPITIGYKRHKTAKVFIQNQYNDWFSDQVARNLKGGKKPTDIKISLKLSDLKLLYAGWIVDLYERMNGESDII